MFETLRHCVMAVSLGHTNVSLYILPLVWMMCSLLHLFALCTYTLSTGKTVGCGQPRNLAQIADSDPALTSYTRGRILRAEAAAKDVGHGAPMFAVAILAGNLVGLSPASLNLFSLAYLVTRTMYVVAYVACETPGGVLVRSILSLSGQGLIWTIFVAAGKET